MKTLLVASLLVAGFGFTGCSASLAQRAERSDGLLEFLFARPRAELSIPVQMVSSSAGTIETAHVRVYGREAFVTGLVGKGMHWSSLGAHIDIQVLNPLGKIAQAYATNFLPSPVSSGRFGHGYSRYAVRLRAIPAAGSTLRVSFHNDAKSTCAFALPAIPGN